MPEAAQIEAEARAVGWRAPEELEAAGKTGNFLSAEDYLERGKAIMPFLKRDNDKLTRRVLEQDRVIAAQQAKVNEALESIKGLEEYHSEMLTTNAKRIREETKRELAAAAKDGDYDEVARLTEVLATPLETPAAKETPKATPPLNPSEDPAFQGWIAANASWVNTDSRKLGIALGIGADIKREFPALIGAAFYAKVDEELAKVEGAPARRSKVGDDGNTPPAAKGNGKSYSDLPADAKAACKIFEGKFAGQIGKDKRYPDVNAWRAKYAADFFKE